MTQITRMLKFHKELMEYRELVRNNCGSPFWVKVYPNEIKIGATVGKMELWQEAAYAVEMLALAYGFTLEGGYNEETGLYEVLTLKYED